MVILSLDLHAPLVPAEVDLRDFGFMPLDVLRLRDSDLMALATGDEFKAAVSLWCVAWHQVPAGSLPDDDRLLARFSGAGPAWRKLREGALRGFVKCSDGRLYHSTIAEKAREAWASKQAQRARTAAATAAREQRRRELEAQRLGQRDVVRDVQRDEPRHDQRDVARDVHQGTGTVKGQGQGQGYTPTSPPLDANPTDAARVGEPPPAAKQTPAGAICRAMKAAGTVDVNPGHPDLLALIEAGATEAEFVGAAQTAAGKGKGFAYAIGALKRQRIEAAQAAQAMHRGPMATDAPPPGRRTAVDRQIATMNALTGKDRSHGPAPAADHANVVDVDARVVP